MTSLIRVVLTYLILSELLPEAVAPPITSSPWSSWSLSHTHTQTHHYYCYRLHHHFSLSYSSVSSSHHHHLFRHHHSNRNHSSFFCFFVVVITTAVLFSRRPIRDEYLIVHKGQLAGTGKHSGLLRHFAFLPVCTTCSKCHCLELPHQYDRDWQTFRTAGKFTSAS